MINSLRARIFILPLACLAGAAHAHHSISANFDTSRQIEIRGEVVSFQFRSPHSSMVVDGIVYVDGVPQGDTPERWEIESSAAAGLRSQGIDRDTFQPGDAVVVVGAPHRNPALHRSNSSNFSKPGVALTPPPPVVAGAAAVPEEATGVQRVQGRWRPPFQPPGTASALPLNEAGLAAWRAYDQKLSPANTCEPMNIPVVFNAPSYLVDIRFSDRQVVVRNQAYDVVRTVPLDGTSAPVDPQGHWGTAGARIEGETLVIDSRDFRPSRWGLGAATQINGGGADVPNSDRKTISERFSVSEDGQTLFYEYTLFDPVYMRQPHEARVALARVADDAPMHPYDCDVESAAMFSRGADERLPE